MNLEMENSIAVLGGSGFVGSRLIQELGPEGTAVAQDDAQWVFVAQGGKAVGLGHGPIVHGYRERCRQVQPGPGS